MEESDWMKRPQIVRFIIVSNISAGRSPWVKAKFQRSLGQRPRRNTAPGAFWLKAKIIGLPNQA
jgi:hypothetical protein